MCDKVEIDNRDITTTRIWTEVDVCELFVNALENAGMTLNQFQAVVDHLDMEHRQLVETDEPLSDLCNGIEWIMQALKQPGYEWS